MTPLQSCQAALGTGRDRLARQRPVRRAGRGNWPNRPVTIVVPFSPGGNTDLIARLMAEKLSQHIGKPFIVENRSGAGGLIAAEYVARAKPDGQTLFMSTMTQIVTAPMTNRIRYDPIRDFAPIINVGGNPFILAASARHGFKTLADLVDYGRANPGALNVGHAGTGGLTHLSALLFLTRANVQATMVPYRGGAQALSDVLAGQIDLYSASVSEVIPYDHRQVIAAGGVQRHTAGPAAGPADHRRNLSGVCRRNLEWPGRPRRHARGCPGPTGRRGPRHRRGSGVPGAAGRTRHNALWRTAQRLRRAHQG